MTDLPEISDEMVDAGALVFRESVKRHGAFIGTETAERWARDILAAALVASGWRPEADVLREVALAFVGETRSEFGRRLVSMMAGLDKSGRATKLEPPLPLPDHSYPRPPAGDEINKEAPMGGD